MPDSSYYWEFSKGVVIFEMEKIKVPASKVQAIRDVTPIGSDVEENRLRDAT